MNRSIVLINSLGIVKEKDLTASEQHIYFINKFANEFGININSKNPVFDSMYLMNYQIITLYTSYDETIIFLPYTINKMQFDLSVKYLNKDNKFIMVTSNNIKDLYKNYITYDEAISKLNISLDNYNRINKCK